MTPLFAAQRRLACIASVCTIACMAAVATHAQTPSAVAPSSVLAAWPTQAVKIVVPFAAGGTTDIAARLLATELAKRWGQAVAVENQPGAATQIGTDFVAKSRDQHTLLMTSAAFAVNPSLFSRLPYDTFGDFRPVTLVVRSGLVLVTAADSRFTSLADVIEAGKNNAQVSMASPGNGTMGHMVAEVVADTKKLNLLHVPYKGTPQAQADVMSGKVQFMFDNPSSALPLIKAGKLKALAYSGYKRSKALPDVPTVGESISGFEALNWFGLVAPSSMPDAAIKRVADDVNSVLRNRDIVDRFAKEGVEVGGISRESFGAYLAVETVRWLKVIRARGIKPD